MTILMDMPDNLGPEDFNPLSVEHRTILIAAYKKAAQITVRELDQESTTQETTNEK